MTPETPAVTPTPTPSAPPSPSAPSTPPSAPNSLAEFRAQKASSLAALTETPAETPPVQKEPPIATDLEPPLVDEGDDLEPPAQPPAEGVKPPEQTAQHRWKDPDTGVTLDLRRRDHRRIKRLLEERSDYARRLTTPPAHVPREQEPPQARQPQPQAYQPDPRDPEPQLEQFADQPDPYAAHTRALAKWEARQEFKQLQATHTRVERARQVETAITSAQEAYDADLPSVKQRFPDFDDAHQDVLDTLARVPQPARVPIVHRLLTSPVRHDLTHYLGSHPADLAAVVQARTPYEQGLVLGAIETRVRALVNQRSRAAAPPNSPAPAPAPMAPVGGSASPVTVPDAKSINTLAQFRALKPKFGMRA